MVFQIISIFILAAFYGCYFIKMLLQKKQGIRTDHLGKGKAGLVRFIEITMKVVTILLPAIELLCIALNISKLPTEVRIAGVCLGLAGTAVFITAVITMKDSWRAGVANDEKTRLITTGIYRISRNPAFLGFDLVYVGILLIFFNWLLLAVSVLAIILFHIQIVYVEEKFLAAVFDGEYKDYKKRVNRYLGRRLI